MKDSLAPGATLTRRITVDADRTISFLGDELRVYATPSMVADIEYTALELIARHTDAGEGSVGSHVSVDHLSATPLGHDVEVTVTVTAVEGRKVSLEAEVSDALERVGRGRHDRFVIDVEKQAERLRGKVARLEAGG